MAFLESIIIFCHRFTALVIDNLNPYYMKYLAVIQFGRIELLFLLVHLYPVLKTNLLLINHSH